MWKTSQLKILELLKRLFSLLACIRPHDRDVEENDIHVAGTSTIHVAVGEGLSESER